MHYEMLSGLHTHMPHLFYNAEHFKFKLIRINLVLWLISLNNRVNRIIIKRKCKKIISVISCLLSFYILIFKRAMSIVVCKVLKYKKAHNSL